MKTMALAVKKLSARLNTNINVSTFSFGKGSSQGIIMRDIRALAQTKVIKEVKAFTT